MDTVCKLTYMGCALAFVIALIMLTSCSASDESAAVLAGPTFILPEVEEALADAITITDVRGNSVAGITATPGYTVVDETTGEIESAFIWVSGVVNACETPPCIAAAETNIATLTITANNDVFTLRGNVEKLDVPIIDQEGAATLLGQYLGVVDIIQFDGSVVVYKVIADYTGIAVSKFMTADNIAELINPMFSEQILVVTLDEHKLSLIGTNIASGLGSIKKTDELPAGYEVTTTNKGAYTFDDPDGANIAARQDVLADISIAERDSYGQVVANNEVIYRVILGLRAPRKLEKEDITIELAGAEWDVDNDQKRISINKLTNACEIPPCISAAADLGVLTLTAVADAFTFAGGATSMDFPISDQSGAASVANVKLGSITISYKADNSDIEYDVIATYRGTPVRELVTADNIADIINPMFNEQTLIITALSSGTIALSGVNKISGTVTIDNGLSLPSGYIITATDGSSYSVSDPDGDGLGNTPVHTLNNLSIGELDVSDNVQTYAVTLVLVNPIEIDASSLSTTIAGAQLEVDNIAAKFILSGFNNVCESPPCREAGDNIGTFTITADPDVFTLENDLANIAFLIPDQPGAASLSDVHIGNIVITGANGGHVEYQLLAQYTGAPVSELVNVNNIAELINPVFNDQILSTTLSVDNIITLSGTNTISGAGNIGAGNKLPAGYEIIQPDGSPYTFSDPAPELTDESSTSLAELSIRELAAHNNVQPYAVMLVLTAPIKFEAHHLTLTGSDVQPEIYNDLHKIVIRGFTNVCILLPCDDLAADLGTLSINKTNEYFTITDGTAIARATLLETTERVTFSIPDQAGAASVIFDLGTLTITRTDDADAVEYRVQVYYSGMPAAEIMNKLAEAEDITGLITAEFAGKTATTITFENNILIINGMPNLPGETGTGSIKLITELLPSGYSITPYSFTNPAGTGAVILPGTLNIVEDFASTDNPGGTSTASDDFAPNQASYDVQVSLQTLVYTPQETTDCYKNDIDAEILLTEFYEDRTANEFVLELYLNKLSGKNYIDICQLGLRAYSRVLANNDVSVDWGELDFSFPITKKLYNNNFYIIRFAAAGTGITSSEVIELSYESETLPVLPASYDNCVLLELYYQQFAEASGEAELLKTLDFVQLGEGCSASESRAVAAAPVYSTTVYAQVSPQLSLPEIDNSLSRKLETSGSARFQTALNNVPPIFSGDDWLQEGRSLLLPTDAHCVTLNDSDADGDGVFDCLEDEAGDTYFGMALYDWGARTNQLDLFWEVDYMACAQSQDYRTAPPRQSLDKWKSTIDAYTIGGLSLKLHLDVGELYDNSPGTNTANYDLGGGNNYLDSHAALSDYYGIFINTTKYDNIKASNFSPGRKQLFYYMLFAQTTSTSGGLSSITGVGELLGNDILITYGGDGPSTFTKSKYYTCDKQTSGSLVHRQYIQNHIAYTMMHEMGHNLSLGHGGDWDNSTNNKPNYLSVMNYAFGHYTVPIPSLGISKAKTVFTNTYYTLNGYVGCIKNYKYSYADDDPGNLIAVSRQSALDNSWMYPDIHNSPTPEFELSFSTGEQHDIDESSVQEIVYINSDVNHAVGIDYDCDHSLEGDVSYQKDLNGDGKISILRDNNDFDNIRFFFGGASYDSVLASSLAVQQSRSLFPMSASSGGNRELKLNKLWNGPPRKTIKARQRVFSDHQPIVEECSLELLADEHRYHGDGDVLWFMKPVVLMEQLFMKGLFLLGFVGTKLLAFVGITSS